MASHELFGHLQHKLWSKEGSGVKLPVWPSTTKSRESTRFRCVQVKCNTLLESSRGELQLWFRPHPDLSLGRGVMSVQSPENQTRKVSGLHFGSHGKKSHLDASAAKSCRKYYMGEDGGFPWVRAVVSQVSPR
jgi:hypothetical protein